MCRFSCWPSTPPEWVQGGEQKWGILCSGKPVWQVFRELDIFRSWFYEPILVSPPILKSTKILPGDSCRSFTRPAETFSKKNNNKKSVFDCRYSPFTKITHIRSFPPAFLEQFLRAIWGALSPRLQSSYGLQIKLHVQLSCCAFFVVESQHKPPWAAHWGWSLRVQRWSQNLANSASRPWGIRIFSRRWRLLLFSH